MTEIKSDIEIKNRKAGHLYFIESTIVAGIVLLGTEIKSIRMGAANMADAFCYVEKGEVYVKNLHISPYKHSGRDQHEPMRTRKLLLKRTEIRKLSRKVTEKGYTLVPTRLFISKSGYAKLEIGLAKGKKSHDKRESIKKRDMKRDMERGKNERY